MFLLSAFRYRRCGVGAKTNQLMNRDTLTVLFLGPEDSPLVAWLRVQGDRIIQTSEKVSIRWVEERRVGCIVAYGYRHILPKEILDRFPGRAVNLHISYLPWNRGADPNLWSFVEGSPKGVTIHYLDEGVDTGDIIVQKEVEFDLDHETLATTYAKLHWTIQELFKQHWPEMRAGTCRGQKQVGEGSSHTVRDKEALLHLLKQGWNTPASALQQYAAETETGVRAGTKCDGRVDEPPSQV